MDIEIEKDCLIKPAFLGMLKKALCGCEQSQLSLAHMYHSGDVYPENQLEAYAWASVVSTSEGSNLQREIIDCFCSDSELLLAQDFGLRLKRIVES